ncbi:hypothetical protein EF910_24300 [Streptomyces sp. WAC07149]|nr:hypothetical protein EF910_24300 [Streptomyces sp. WAC07149]
MRGVRGVPLRGALPHPAPSRNRGSAPDPGPQTPDGLEVRCAHPSPSGDGRRDPAPPAFEARVRAEPGERWKGG